MAKVALLTIHGMGETREDYAQGLLAALRGRLGARWSDVSAHRVYYQGLLQENEDAVWARMKDHVRWPELRMFLLYGFADAAGLENGRQFADSVYTLAQLEIARNLFAARQAVGAQGPVVVISQSLGCQVFSSYLWDAQKAAAGQRPAGGLWAAIELHEKAIAGRPLSAEERGFLGGGTLRRWLTTGCNIPIFVAAHKHMVVKPIARPTPDFQWLNLYDRDDVLGWPLQPLSPGYASLVQDRAVNVGRGLWDWAVRSWNPGSHTGYWEDGDVLDPLEAMLREFA